MSFTLKPVADQVVVIIGASSGMGRSAAAMFAQAGAKVVAAARGLEGLASLRDEIRGQGGACETLTCDVADPDQVKAVADLAIERFGRIDTFVNTAGVWATCPFEETTAGEFNRIIDVNLKGQANALRVALPHLRANVARGEPGGAFIGFASILGRIGHPLVSAYCASKWGVIGLLDAVRIELLQQQLPISITAILPFGTNTPIYDTGLSRIGSKPRPAKTIINPEVVAKAVVHAAAHPIRQVQGSGQSQAINLLYQTAPALMDELLAEMLTPANQASGEPVLPDGLTNVFGVVPDRRVRGMFDAESADRSAYVDLQIGEQPVDGLSEVEATLDGLLSAPAVAHHQIDAPALKTFLLGVAAGQALQGSLSLQTLGAE